MLVCGAGAPAISQTWPGDTAPLAARSAGPPDEQVGEAVPLHVPSRGDGVAKLRKPRTGDHRQGGRVGAAGGAGVEGHGARARGSGPSDGSARRTDGEVRDGISVEVTDSGHG